MLVRSISLKRRNQKLGLMSDPSKQFQLMQWETLGCPFGDAQVGIVGCTSYKLYFPYPYTTFTLLLCELQALNVTLLLDALLLFCNINMLPQLLISDFTSGKGGPTLRGIPVNFFRIQIKQIIIKQLIHYLIRGANICSHKARLIWTAFSPQEES